MFLAFRDELWWGRGEGPEIFRKYVGGQGFKDEILKDLTTLFPHIFEPWWGVGAEAAPEQTSNIVRRAGVQI